jgi:hypothetical protein
MHPWQLLAVNAAQRLAIDTQEDILGDPCVGQPSPDDPLKCCHIHVLEHPVERRHAWTAPRRHPQRLKQVRIILQPFPRPLGNGKMTARPAEHRRHAHLQQRNQAIHPQVRPPPIRQPRQCFP